MTLAEAGVKCSRCSCPRSARYHNVGRCKPLGDWRVNLTDAGCWEWAGNRDVNGYGMVLHHNRRRRACRVAMHFAVGFDLADSRHVLHRCDNPPCVNPDHLWLGTVADNSADMAAKGRAGRSKLTAEQVREIRAVLADPATPYQHGLAARYGVSGSAIRLIGRGLTYRWVDSDAY